MHAGEALPSAQRFCGADLGPGGPFCVVVKNAAKSTAARCDPGCAAEVCTATGSRRGHMVGGLTSGFRVQHVITLTPMLNQEGPGSPHLCSLVHKAGLLGSSG